MSSLEKTKLPMVVTVEPDHSIKGRNYLTVAAPIGRMLLDSDASGDSLSRLMAGLYREVEDVTPGALPSPGEAVVHPDELEDTVRNGTLGSEGSVMFSTKQGSLTEATLRVLGNAAQAMGLELLVVRPQLQQGGLGLDV